MTSERAGEARRDAVRQVGGGHIRPLNRHRRAAARLQGRDQRQAELGLSVLYRELPLGREGLLVRGLGMVVTGVDARRAGGDEDLDLRLVAEPSLLAGHDQAVA